MTFFEFSENLKNYSVKKFIDDLALQLDNSNEVIALQIEQWDRGEDSDGRVLGFYTKNTEILSGGRKKEGDRYNLFDTGDFRRKSYLFSMEKSNDLIFQFDSSGINTQKLLAKIGPTIFGLQEKNKDKFIQIAQDLAIDNLNTNLKLK